MHPSGRCIDASRGDLGAMRRGPSTATSEATGTWLMAEPAGCRRQTSTVVPYRLRTPDQHESVETSRSSGWKLTSLRKRDFEKLFTRLQVGSAQWERRPPEL